MTQLELQVSLFERRTDNIPTRTSMSWDEFVASLREDLRACSCTLSTCHRSENWVDDKGVTHDGCAEKDGLAWSPAIWPDGAKRARRTVEAVSLLVADLDHIPNDEHLAAAFGAMDGLKFAAHASHSDRPGDRCVRIVFALSRPVLGSEWRRFWRAALEQLGLLPEDTDLADKQCKDTSRLYYLPSRPSDALRDAGDGTGFLHLVQDGQPLDVDQILHDAPLEEEDVASEGEFTVPEFAGAPTESALELAAQALGQAWPGTGRHGAQLALAGALARQGWPADLIAQFAARVADIQEPGNGMVGKRQDAARDSVAKMLAGEAIQGWPTLEEHVGVDACREAKRALGIRDIAESTETIGRMVDRVLVQRLRAELATARAQIIEEAKDNDELLQFITTLTRENLDERLREIGLR